MLYSNREEYIFHFPQEYSYYRRFKQDLQDLEIHFTEVEDGNQHRIIIQSSAIFNDGELISNIKSKNEEVADGN